MKDVELISIEINSEITLPHPFLRLICKSWSAPCTCAHPYHLGSGSYETVMDSCSSCQRPRTHVTQNHRARLSLKL